MKKPKRTQVAFDKKLQANVMDVVSPTSDVESLLSSVWPNGVPPEELALLATLSADRRAKLIERLRALQEASLPGADLTAIAGKLGLGRTAFFELRKNWARERSLKVVVPWATRPARRKALNVEVPHDDTGNSADDGHPIDAAAALSVPTMRRRTREQMREEAAQPAVLRARFGREFVLDVSAVNVIVKDDRSPRWRTCAFLIERASGLILSAVAGGPSDSPSIRQAARAGRQKIDELRLAVRDPSLTVVMPEPHGHEAASWLRDRIMLAEALGEDRVLFDGARRFGAALVESVGERVGGIGLRPRATPWTVPTAKQILGAPEPSSHDMDVLLSVEVSRHNQVILKRLRRMGLVAGKGDPQPLLDLLDAAFPP